MFGNSDFIHRGGQLWCCTPQHVTYLCALVKVQIGKTRQDNTRPDRWFGKLAVVHGEWCVNRGEEVAAWAGAFACMLDGLALHGIDGFMVSGR